MYLFIARLKNGEYDISKIPDIYDCIKYDIQHNMRLFRFTKAEELHVYSKAMADIVIPQVYMLIPHVYTTCLYPLYIPQVYILIPHVYTPCLYPMFIPHVYTTGLHTYTPLYPMSMPHGYTPCLPQVYMLTPHYTPCLYPMPIPIVYIMPMLTGTGLIVAQCIPHLSLSLSLLWNHITLL